MIKKAVQSKKGFSLLELIISLAMTAVIGIVVVSLINQVLIRGKGGEESFRAQSDAQATMSRVSKEIRQASQLVLANQQSITFLMYKQVGDTAPYQVRFYLNGSTLNRGETPPTGAGPIFTYDPASEVVRPLSTRIGNSADAIFSYFDEDGNELSSPINLVEVTLVEVNLIFNQSNNTQPFKVETKVQLRFNKTNL